MKLTRFEDIHAWQESRKLTSLIYPAINSSTIFKSDFRLSGQIQAASVSAMSNIAEGFSRKGHKEFIQFLFIAKALPQKFKANSTSLWIRTIFLKIFLKKYINKRNQSQNSAPDSLTT